MHQSAQVEDMWIMNIYISYNAAQYIQYIWYFLRKIPRVFHSTIMHILWLSLSLTCFNSNQVMEDKLYQSLYVPPLKCRHGCVSASYCFVNVIIYPCHYPNAGLDNLCCKRGPYTQHIHSIRLMNKQGWEDIYEYKEIFVRLSPMMYHGRTDFMMTS